tara:strand:- start:6868 stop:7218 length:351 start_codon:yes stop_codon:yes gene_type:complete
LITDEMKKAIATYLQQAVGPLIVSGQIGLGGNSTNPTSLTLDVPSGVTPAIVKNKSDENIVEIKLTIAGSAIQGKVIREMGLFDSSGNLLARENFDGVGPFSTSETLEIFYIIEVE